LLDIEKKGKGERTVRKKIKGGGEKQSFIHFNRAGKENCDLHLLLMLNEKSITFHEERRGRKGGVPVNTRIRSDLQRKGKNSLAH